MNIKNGNNIAIIYNPKAGQKGKEFLNRVVYLLEDNNLKTTFFVTKYPGNATELAEEISQNKKYKSIIAAGGDGTINEIINGIYGSNMPLGIIPLGTVSVLARDIGLKLTPGAVADALIQGNIKEIYPAIINGKCFSLMASVGVDASSVKNVNLGSKKKISKIAYVISFLREVLRSKFLCHSLKLNENIYKSYSTIIANGKLYAGEYVCAPEATIYDQYLYIVMLKKKGLVGLVKFFWAIFQNNTENSQQIEIVKTKKLSIFSDHAEDIQIDGEYFGQLPVTINASEKSINRIVPVS